MVRVTVMLEQTAIWLGLICGVYALFLPFWFGLSALGTKWGFFDWSVGLDLMTHTLGAPLIVTGLVVGGLCGLLIIIHRFMAGEFATSFTGVLAVLVVSGLALTAKIHVDQTRASRPVLLDVTTDTLNPPHFSTSFIARRDAGDMSLDYASKRGPQGSALGDYQAGLYPRIRPLNVPAEPEVVFSHALRTARDLGWRIGAASRQSGMFEAGAESFWYGFRDDIAVRVTVREAGGAIVDVRSLAREDVHDLGRNADRVIQFLDLLAQASGGRLPASATEPSDVERGEGSDI